MEKTTLYNQKGEKKGDIKLPESIFGVKWNPDLVHQVMTVMQSNARTVIAHTKDRSEVRGGGRKPWRQKGTGRARHGSRRSPIWVGGGVTFGPTNERNFSKSVNKKMKAQALFSVLSEMNRNGHVIFVDSMTFANPKTKEAKEVLEALSKSTGFENMLTKKNNSVFVALAEKDTNTQKSFSNFGNVEVDEVRNLNVLDLLNTTYLVVVDPETSFSFLESKLS